MSLNIGGVLDPTSWHKWEEAKAYLEPARKLAGENADLIRPDLALWVVMDGDELLAACTARIAETDCEILLVGGRDHKRWLHELDQTIGAAARDAGAKRMVAIGRRGWAKALTAQGWAKQDGAGGFTGYTRELTK